MSGNAASLPTASTVPTNLLDCSGLYIPRLPKDRAHSPSVALRIASAKRDTYRGSCVSRTETSSLSGAGRLDTSEKMDLPTVARSKTLPIAAPKAGLRVTLRGWELMAQFEIASSERSLTLGPSSRIESAAISMLPAMKVNTPTAPKRPKMKAMTKALSTVDSRLQE